jgi:DNA mismatch endonuclease (patch repair protein)
MAPAGMDPTDVRIGRSRSAGPVAQDVDRSGIEEGTNMDLPAATREPGRKYLRDGRAPIPEKEATSRVMSANRGRDTSPERALRRELRRVGRSGYRLHAPGVPGRPDVAFLSQKVAVFVHGCYWHRCPRCQMPLPRTHTGFWKAKFEANQLRDRRKEELLAQRGWKVVTLWECEIREGLGEAVAQVLAVLGPSRRP